MEGSLVAYKTFTNGSVLPASDVQTYLMDQSVMVFSSSATRAAALTAPVEGMLTWLQDTNKYENYNGTAWVALGGSGVLQVVSTTKTDTFTMASTTYADVTGLSATITPSSATSKIYVLAIVSSGSQAGTNASAIRLMRTTTAIAVADAASNRTPSSSSAEVATNTQATLAVNFLDSPATTSATTYKVQLRSNTASTVTVNRSFSDVDAATSNRTVSTLTLMEVAG